MTAQDIWKVIAELWPVFSSMDITCVWAITNIWKSHITHSIPKKNFFLRLIRVLLMEFYIYGGGRGVEEEI